MLTSTCTLSILQYDLEELKRRCFQELFPSITAENAAEALITADLYKAKEIKAAAIAFIRE